MLGVSKVKLGIPEPCQESWDVMGSGPGSRFCEKCQHEVVDFTVLTRGEAERIFKAAKGRVCGRLAQDGRGNAVYRPDAGRGHLARVAGLSLVAIAGVAAQRDCDVRVNVTDSSGATVTQARVLLTATVERPISPGVIRRRCQPGSIGLR